MTARLPTLPVPRPAQLLAPARFLPAPLLESLIARLARDLLTEAIADGALELLEGRLLAVHVTNPTMRLRFTLADNRIRRGHAGPADVTIMGQAEDLILLAARRTDPDTLFFQRRLSLSGDTELGLAIKNVLDTVALDALPRPLPDVLARLASLVEGTQPQPPAS